MVGDRLDTDVKFGKDGGGMKSALVVLTGCTTANKLKEVGVATEEEHLTHIMIPPTYGYDVCKWTMICE